MTSFPRVGPAKVGSKSTKVTAAPVRKSDPAPTIAGPVAKLKAIRDWACARVVGRKAEIELLILAVASRSNVLLLGVPGTAKTMMVDLVSRSFCAGPNDFFDVLMTKFTTPSEVFGPTDVVGLRDKGVMRIATDGFLPTCKVGFLDEIFKSSSAILNALLRISNERRFRNGSNWTNCPVRFIVGASNEFPEDPATLAAFYDRFPLKMMVDSLEDAVFGDMIRVVSARTSTGNPPVVMTDADFAELDALVDAVVFPEHLCGALTELRGVLREKGIRPSDRRWAQCVRIMRASAVLRSRTTATREDLGAIVSVLWSTKEEIGQAKTEVTNMMHPIDRVLREVTDAAWAERKEILNAYDSANSLANASLAATKALSKIKDQEAMLQVVEERMIETDEDREKLAMAQGAILRVREAIEAVCLSKPDSIQKVRELDDIGPALDAS